jgi:aspartate carbamoyltransferase regulatory subunit
VNLRDIILKDAVALEKWSQVTDHIVKKEADKLKIKNMLRNYEYAEAILLSLQAWHSEGQCKDLVHVLQTLEINSLSGNQDLLILVPNSEFSCKKSSHSHFR